MPAYVDQIVRWEWYCLECRDYEDNYESERSAQRGADEHDREYHSADVEEQD